MSTAFDPFDVLAQEHQQLTRLFADHQEALLERDWVSASELLNGYRERLYRHMEIEERFVLEPAETPVASGCWAGTLYRAEHRRIKLFMEKADEWLVRARSDGAAPGMLINLLDRERTLKHLLEHHHHREEIALFSDARRTLPAELRAALGRALAEQHAVSA